jgi:hypothetical protein
MRGSWLRLVVRAASITGVWLMWSAATTVIGSMRHLQATRIDDDRVDLIDLTPGTAVARQVFGWIDTDGTGRSRSVRATLMPQACSVRSADCTVWPPLRPPTPRSPVPSRPITMP